MIAPPDLDLARQIMATLPQPTARKVADATGAQGDRVARTLEGLIDEGFVEVTGGGLWLTELGREVMA